jgi:hypothetical protein
MPSTKLLPAPALMMVIPAVIRLKASLSASSASDIKRLTTIMEACLPAEEFYEVTDSSFNVAELKDKLLGESIPI